MAHKKIAAFGAVFLLLTAAACSNSTSEPSVKDPDALELVITNIHIPDVDHAAFNDEGYLVKVVDGTLIYESAGSSSCRPILNSASLKDNVVTAIMSDYSQMDCTDDLAPFRQELNRADGEPIAADAQFVIETAPFDGTANTPTAEDFTVTDVETADWPEFDEGTYYDITIEDGVVVYSAGGAGGCPPVMERAEYRDGVLTLVGKDWGDIECEENYVVVTQRIERADGTPIPDGTEVLVDQPSLYYSNYHS